VKRNTVSVVVLVLTVFVLILGTPGRASAYVDPGSGAMMWQMLAAACLGSMFYVRKVVRKLRSIFANASEHKSEGLGEIATRQH
jgi:hypothetical protein